MKQNSTVTTSTRMHVAFALIAVLGCGRTDVPSAALPIDEAESAPMEVEVNEPTIRITISGAKSQLGVYSCGVFGNESDFNARSNAIKSASIPVPSDTSEPAQWDIRNVPPGTYTIAIFHDENENGKLDRHAFGYPTETYGFSNNARGKFGPPNYADVRFKFAEQDLEMQIQLK